MLLAPTTIAARLTEWLEGLPPELRTTVSLSIIVAIVIGLRALRRRG
jgi:hypothetical protein